MKRTTLLRIFGVLFVVTILYRSRVDASAHPAPIAGPLAEALADPWPSPFADAVGKRRSAKKGRRKTTHARPAKVLSSLTSTLATAAAQAAGAHVAERILSSDE